jgi:CO/xanthine dehydrogenase Mo-binding subunit
VSAAVANAVKDAIGVRFTELPIAPAVVRNALAWRARERRA